MEVAVEHKPLKNGAMTARQNSDMARILIVDDEESILWSLSRTLTLSNDSYIVGTARSAEEALDILQSTPVDVMLTDLKLPKMNGLDLVKTVKELCPSTRAILMTAYGNDTILKKANDAGFAAYIEKPFAIDRLVEYIDSALHPTTTARFELSGLSIADIVQLYALKQQSIILNVLSKDEKGSLIIENGVLCHAEFGREEGPPALISILHCSDILVRTVPGKLPSRRTLSLTWNDLRVASGLASQSQQLKLFQGEDVLLKAPKPDEPQKKTASQKRARATKNDPPSGEGSHEALQGEEVVVGDYRLLSIVSPGVLNADKGHQALRSKSPLANIKKSNHKSDEGDFKSDDLVLGPEPSPPPPVHIPTKREERAFKLRQLVNAGIDQFRNHQLEEAKHSWVLALRMDPHCDQAKRNLEVLESVIKKQSEKASSLPH